ncbi:NADPH-dependent ferric siderophore reductase, contains FAD-binding and SIP domains [Kaistia soli DSM 19436]|uniref:NADPH-dependent ferric siderophore reductase, contains FAD-binding and SIP domains n=1 Tax=Kaistia soli DSM 19436 TaxID=1122133 RepID=A0A1M5DR40_9HYPH|nr:siderophore-interacting protein [Kaistia soli]SHF69344.1 NADPH-dependent ferric siderophore reductase, contains FAD-binding and SIP domains [Kaistia soli DSM 19436]
MTETTARPEETVLPHTIRRVRHETRRRALTVTATKMLTPRMKRVHLAGDMEGFASLGADDHIKLFFADTAGGTAMRDFTPRAFNVAAGTIVIDFALHEAGPATSWAAIAEPGATLEIGGPRGSAVVPDDFDWYWLIGDETALPAIGRWVEGLRAGVPVLTAVAIGSRAERQAFATSALWTGLWAERDVDGGDDAATLLRLLDSQALPTGDGFVFIAAESTVARALKARIAERGHPKASIKAAGYWKRGEADAHERIED